MINFRYGVKDVIVGRVLNLDKEGLRRVGLIAVSKMKSRLCVVDKVKEEAIDFMEPDKRYPFIGEEDGDFLIRREPLENDKEYALMMEETTYPSKTKKLLIKDLKKRGVI